MNILMLLFGLFQLSSHILIGKGEEQISPKIHKGVDAKRSESKFMVSLRDKNDEKKYGFGVGHFCGGSLVTPNKILTAAHCVQDPETMEWTPVESIVAVLGIIKRSKKDSSTSVHDIDHYIAHRDCDFKKTLHDIALLLMKGSIDPSNPNIQTIPLPQQDTKVGELCRAIGWGWIDEPKGNLTEIELDALMNPQHLQMAMIIIVDKPGCSGKGRLCGVGSIDQQSLCSGDSGGPLICKGVLVGVSSFVGNKSDGTHCFSGNWVAFTNVYYYRSWYNDVAKQLDKLSFATKSFHFLHVTLILLEILLYILI